MIVDERVRREVAASTRFGDIREWATIDSTNRWLADQAAAGAPEGLVAVADHQEAGRGRLGRTWDAPPGTALLVSVLLRPQGLAPGRLHLVTAAVGLSAREACREVAGVEADLKWPNDLLIGAAKLAGVLAEARGDAVVVGIGCNVAAAPPGAAALEAVAGRPVDRGVLLGALLVALEDRCGRWDDVAAAYRATCATVGRRVRVSRPGGDLVGDATGIDHDGRLLVQLAGGGVEAVAAGDVTHLRMA